MAVCVLSYPCRFVDAKTNPERHSDHNCQVFPDVHRSYNAINYALQHNVMLHNLIFIDRDEELEFLQNAYESDKSQSIVLTAVISFLWSANGRT